MTNSVDSRFGSEYWDIATLAAENAFPGAIFSGRTVCLRLACLLPLMRICRESVIAKPEHKSIESVNPRITVEIKLSDYPNSVWPSMDQRLNRSSSHQSNNKCALACGRSNSAIIIWSSH